MWCLPFLLHAIRLPAGFVVDPNQLFAKAEAAFLGSRWDDARSNLSTLTALLPDHPAVLHLLALVEKEAGRLAASRDAFARAIKLAPNDPQIANNFATVLDKLGERVQAIAFYDHAIKTSPSFTQAKLNRAISLSESGLQHEANAAFSAIESSLEMSPRFWNARAAMEYGVGDFTASATHYDRALAINPDDAVAIRGRARIALERGEAMVVERIAHARALFPDDLGLIIEDAEAREALGMQAPDTKVVEALERNPAWVAGHKALARIRWEAGAGREFTAMLQTAIKLLPDNRELRLANLEILAGAGLSDELIIAVERGRAVLGDDPHLCLFGATHASSLGQRDEAEGYFTLVPDEFEGKALSEAQHRIRIGALDHADDLLDLVSNVAPFDTSMWSLRGLIWRMIGDARHEWLHGQDGLINNLDLGLSAAAITDIGDCLRSLHVTRAQPIGQSLRSGTQTRGRLFERLDPKIIELKAAVERSIEQHRNQMPRADATHPLLRHRDMPLRLRGSWSVRLTGGGFHVSHIHPEGILSSACYLALPEANGEAGWLHLGLPPADLSLDLPPMCVIQPRVGHVALFPSTLHHGTFAFATGERLTAAFDVTAASD